MERWTDLRASEDVGRHQNSLTYPKKQLRVQSCTAQSSSTFEMCLLHPRSTSNSNKSNGSPMFAVTSAANTVRLLGTTCVKKILIWFSGNPLDYMYEIDLLLHPISFVSPLSVHGLFQAFNHLSFSCCCHFGFVHWSSWLLLLCLLFSRVISTSCSAEMICHMMLVSCLWPLVEDNILH